MSVTAINATWVWEEVSAGTFWLKVKATLLANNVGVSNRVISIYMGGSKIIDKTTDVNGYVEYIFALSSYTGTRAFTFNFGGDGTYPASSATINVMYLEIPPTISSSFILPVIGIAGFVMAFSGKWK